MCAATGVNRLEGDGRVQRVILSDRSTIACDFVVPALGMVPHKELVRGTALAAEKAILVNAHCRTSDSNVYAAGDCAAVFDPTFGKYRQLDHWESALRMGQIAGANMAGGDESYSGANTFSTELFALTIRGWGEPRIVQRRILRGNQNPDDPDFIEIGVADDGRVAQVLSGGHGGEAAVMAALVERRINVNGKEAMARDSSVALERLLKE